MTPRRAQVFRDKDCGLGFLSESELLSALDLRSSVHHVIVRILLSPPRFYVQKRSDCAVEKSWCLDRQRTKNSERAVCL
jgi:hypothetical protein